MTNPMERSSRPTRPRRRGKPWTDLVVGLTILSAGVIFWLDHLGRLNARDYLHWWPVVVIAFGLAQLTNRQWISAGIWIIVGVAFLLPLLGYPTIPFLRLLGLWPLVYCAAGAALLTQAFRTRDRQGGFHALAVMGANVRRLGKREFDGGDAIAVMGGCEIDLADARLQRESIIDVLAFWGGIGIRVPRGWNVVQHTTTILGGIEDKTEEADETAPRLVVRGTVIMGGLEIRHEAAV